jgi:hypothetical protein
MKDGSCAIHIVGFRNTHPFLVYDEMDLNQSRHRIHLGQEFEVNPIRDCDLIIDSDWSFDED